MFVDAFIKELRANPFSESLIQNRVNSMAERTVVFSDILVTYGANFIKLIDTILRDVMP